MQVNVAGIRRNIKNLAHNYSDAQVKVREATSNDPWGPSATVMAEIADLTYNTIAFTEIMQMIWKRLNDHGKNWRHVYKALILLEYLIKTGTEKVGQQCKENIFAIQTLKEFVHTEEGKDQGLHVREKAKQLVALLRDDERLKNERTKALKAKERFAQHASGFGSEGYIDLRLDDTETQPAGWQPSEPPKGASEIEFVRPQTAGEEELQLQLAMAMSREEAEQEEAKRRSDDVRLQLALSQSEQDFNHSPSDRRHGSDKSKQQSHLLDLLDISLGATSISSPLGGGGGAGAVDPWGTPAHNAPSQSDPWSRTSSSPVDPWQTPTRGAIPSLPDGWLPGPPPGHQRTQSPSGSGSSNEGWLPSRATPTSGLNGNLSTSASGTDPWLSKQLGFARDTPPVDPWLSGGQQPSGGIDDPWRPKAADPWAPTHFLEKRPSPVGATTPASDLDEFDVITNRNKTGQYNYGTNGSNNNNSSLLDDMDPLSSKKQTKTPQSFLGENSSLVNLDNLIKPNAPNALGTAAYNPFSDVASEISAQPKQNLFQQQQTQAIPSINQLKQQQTFPMSLNQDPWAPVSGSAGNTTAQVDEYFIACDSDQITVCTNNNSYYQKFNGNQYPNTAAIIFNSTYRQPPPIPPRTYTSTSANVHNNNNNQNSTSIGFQHYQNLYQPQQTNPNIFNYNSNFNSNSLCGIFASENANSYLDNNNWLVKPEAAASNPFLT